MFITVILLILVSYKKEVSVLAKLVRSSQTFRQCSRLAGPARRGIGHTFLFHTTSIIGYTPVTTIHQPPHNCFSLLSWTMSIFPSALGLAIILGASTCIIGLEEGFGGTLVRKAGISGLLHCSEYDLTYPETHVKIVRVPSLFYIFRMSSFAIELCRFNAFFATSGGNRDVLCPVGPEYAPCLHMFGYSHTAILSLHFFHSPWKCQNFEACFLVLFTEFRPIASWSDF